MARFWSISTMNLAVVLLSIWASQVVGDDVGLVGIAVPWSIPCLEAVVNTQGCVEEIVTSFLTLQARIIGPACCRSAINVDDNCWPKIFPFNPFFPPLLKSFCNAEIFPPQLHLHP